MARFWVEHRIKFFIEEEIRIRILEHKNIYPHIVATRGAVIRPDSEWNASSHGIHYNKNGMKSILDDFNEVFLASSQEIASKESKNDSEYQELLRVEELKKDEEYAEYIRLKEKFES